MSVATESGNSQFTLSAGEAIIVAGPNGTGKSAFLSEIYRSLGEEVATFLPGHRQINFNGSWDALGMGVDHIYKQLFQHFDNFNRYKNSWAEEQFKSELKILQNREVEFGGLYRQRLQRQGEFVVATDSMKDGPIDVVNEVFLRAALPVRFEMTRSGISAVRGARPPYSIESLSDGERAALYLAAAFGNRVSGSVLLIDEPEKHLDQSISALLIEACLRSRDDICVIMSTHDHRLLRSLSETTVLHVRNSEIVSLRPEKRRYDLAAITPDGSELDDLRRDLMGVRDRVLFVEGLERSEDLALYSLVYEGVKVLPKGEWNAVCDATRGIGRLVEGHWIEPRGLIDGDGRSIEEIEALAEDGIHVLPCPSIENLFFTRECIACFVLADMKFRGGDSEEARYTALTEAVKKSVAEEMESIVAHRAAWRLERELSNRKVSPRNLRAGERSEIVVDVASLYDEVKEYVQSISCSDDFCDILVNLPIKKTKIPSNVAKALGATSFSEYKKTILRQMEIREEVGVETLLALRKVLPKVFSVDATAYIAPDSDKPK